MTTTSGLENPSAGKINGDSNVVATPSHIADIAASSTPVAPTNTPTTASTSHLRFLDLSGELRNRIYDFALVQKDPIEIKKGACDIPSLVHVNRQIWKECRLLYVSSNKFTFIATNADMSALFRFLKTLNIDGDAAGIKLLGELSIFCHGMIFPSKKLGTPFTYPSFEDWELWHRNLKRLKATGLAPAQIKWLVWMAVEDKGSRILGWDEFSPGEMGAMKDFFHCYFLEHLMKELRFFSKTNRPLALVYDQVKDDHEEVGLDSDAADEMEGYIEKYCPDRGWGYAMYRREVIYRRNELVEAIIDGLFLACSFSKDALPMLLELHEFDVNYGSAINRDPAAVSRLCSLIREKTCPEATDSTSLQSQFDKELAKLGDIDDEETEETKKARLEDEQALECLHQDEELEEHVSHYVERVTRVI